MARKFHEGIDALKTLIEQSGYQGAWSETKDKHEFRSSRGGIVTYWPSTRTVRVQGASPEQDELKALLDDENSTVNVDSTVQGPNKKVFVVYGHDKYARTQLEAMLQRWGLEPVILDQLPSKGQTIIEKLEDYTEDVGYGVVLATPDDSGHPKDHADQQAYRARQNVVLELGMLLVKLGREKVAILVGDQGKMERPSDIQGLIYIPFKDDLQRETSTALAKEMNAQGYKITVENL